MLKKHKRIVNKIKFLQKLIEFENRVKISQYLASIKGDTVLGLIGENCCLELVQDLIKRQLFFITRGEDLSFQLFGVKSLAREAALILDNHYSGEKPVWEAVREFCKGNTCLLVKIVKAVAGADDFKAEPDQIKDFEYLVRECGEATALKILVDSDWTDIVRGVRWARSDKKKLAELKENILDNFKLFPVSCHGRMLHDYLVDAIKRDEKALIPKGPRVNNIPAPVVEIPSEVDGFKVLVPTHDQDLRKIGNAQGHCVGTAHMGYAGKVRKGESAIFAIYTRTLADGVCVEVERDTLEVLQAQGKHRRDPRPEEKAVIRKLLPLFKQYQAVG